MLRSGAQTLLFGDFCFADLYLSSLSQLHSAEMQEQLLSCLNSDHCFNRDPWDKKVTRILVSLRSLSAIFWNYFKYNVLQAIKTKISELFIKSMILFVLLLGLWPLVFEPRRRSQLRLLLLQQPPGSPALQHRFAGLFRVPAAQLFWRCDQKQKSPLHSV